VDRVLREEVWIGGGTPLWQAIVAAIKSLARKDEKRVVLLVTNGIDTGRLPGFPGRRSDAEDDAVRTSTMIYAVRIGTPGHWDSLSGDLKSLIDLTGGGFVDVPPTANLVEVFSSVAEQLRHRYLIGFALPAPGDATLSIVLRSARAGLTVRTQAKTDVGGDR
jgi:hypothetical protein